jgi:6-phosphogluconolactonase (cycloisomerase 2 family)
MRIRSLGPLAKLSVPALLLVLAGCGTNNANSNNNQSGGCSGCSFVYATTNDGQLLTFPAQTGGALGTPATTPGAPDSAYVSAPTPGNTFYVADSQNNAIDAFYANENNGTATAIGTVSLGTGPGSPTGILQLNGYLYVGDTNGTISVLGTGGTGLTPISGSPFQAGGEPLNLATASVAALYGPNVSVLYSADFTGGAISGFTIESDGSLLTIPGFPTLTPPNGAPTEMYVGSSSNGGILYVALSGLNEIEAFNIVESTGELVPLTGSPFAAGRAPVSLAGYHSFLYALNSLDHTISGYTMDRNTGALTEIAGSPFAAGTAAAGLISGFDGALYVPDTQSNAVLGFSVNTTTGSLTPLAGSPFPAIGGPVALTSVFFQILTPP